jgi:hypothetical protein
MRYLLITYVRKANGQIDEQVSVSKRKKMADVQSCNIILDYKTRKIEQCVIEGSAVKAEWDRIHEYYKRIYPVLIAQLEKDNTSEQPAENNEDNKS